MSAASLPEDLWKVVWSFAFGHLSQVLPCTLVSKKWRALLLQPGALPHLKVRCRAAGLIRTYRITQLLPHIEHLTCVNIWCITSMMSIYFGHLHALRTLHLKTCIIDDNDLQTIGKCMPLLQTLSFKWKSVSSSGLAALAGLDRLQCLYLDTCTWTPPEHDLHDLGVQEITNMKSLRYLTLPASDCVSDAAFAALGTLPKLTCLDVTQVTSITFDGVREFLETLIRAQTGTLAELHLPDGTASHLDVLAIMESANTTRDHTPTQPVQLQQEYLPLTKVSLGLCNLAECRRFWTVGCAGACHCDVLTHRCLDREPTASKTIQFLKTLHWHGVQSMNQLYQLSTYPLAKNLTSLTLHFELSRYDDMCLLDVATFGLWIRQACPVLQSLRVSGVHFTHHGMCDESGATKPGHSVPNDKRHQPARFIMKCCRVFDPSTVRCMRKSLASMHVTMYSCWIGQKKLSLT